MKIPQIYQDFREEVSKQISSELNLDANMFPCIKKENISGMPFFDNDVTLYFDDASLPISCNSILDLRNKYVLYGILSGNGMYAGRTDDIGERLSTHLCDSKKREEKYVHKAMLKNKENLSFVFCECPDLATLKAAEKIAIRTLKNCSVKQETNNDVHFRLVTGNKKFLKEYQLKHCYNIND